MEGIGDESCQRSVLGSLGRASELALAVEDIAPGAFADGHAEIDVEANLCDAHARVLLVLGEQVGVVMGVVVMRVARMAAGLRLRLGGGHGGRGNVSCAVDGGGPVEGRTRGECGFSSRGLQDAQLWAGDCRVMDERTR